MTEQRKFEAEDAKARKLMEQDPVAGVELREKILERHNAGHAERMRKLVAGTRLAGIFKTKQSARKAIERARQHLSEMGYYSHLVIERVNAGFIGIADQPEWYRLGSKGYAKCNPPRWAHGTFGFCM